MRDAEMWKLLALAATVDNRNVTPEQVQGWMASIGDLGLEECTAALWAHRRTSTEYLQPAHIAALVAAAREERPAVSTLDQERTALDEFVAYTGIDARVAAERWNDEPWKREQIDVARKAARKAYEQQAIEGGTA